MADQGKQWIITVAGILMFITIFGVPIAEGIGRVSVGSSFIDLTFLSSLSKSIGQYVFGITEGTMQGFGGLNLTPYAFIVIFMMLWLIIFVTFGDIFEAFSSFNPAISWLIAFCLAVIGGMTGVYGGMVGKVTSWFVVFGASAVYLGLATCFVMFLLVNTGLGFFIPKFKQYALERKIMQEELSVRGHLGSAAAAARALEGFGKEIQKDGSGI